MQCTNCGTTNPEDAKVCGNCGQPLAGGADEAKDAADNKLMGILSYIIFFIPLITGDANKSPFVKFHVNQGLLVFLALIASSILMVIPIIGWILGMILYVVTAVFAVLGIIGVTKGEKKELPVIGKIQIIK